MSQETNDLYQDLFAEACDIAVRDFRAKNELYDAAVKRRADISGAVKFLRDEPIGITLTPEQHKLLAEYYDLLTGDMEADVYVACYERGMRDCFMLMQHIGLVKESEVADER